jgi:hypothetical protein
MMGCPCFFLIPEEKPSLLVVIYNIPRLNSIVLYGKYCALFRCPKGVLGIALVKEVYYGKKIK